MNVAYGELFGELKPSTVARSSAPTTNVILTSISHGVSTSPAWQGMTIRYVGRGTEHYRIDGRYYRLSEDQLMIAPQKLGAEIEIKKADRAGTLGLCLFFPEVGDGSDMLVDSPVVLPASCDLGLGLKSSLERLRSPRRPGGEPDRIAGNARLRVRDTILALDRQIESVAGLKRRTRFEAVRKMNLARAYLHQVTDRAVALDELAREAAMSPFQLLRCFRDCFGDTPAAYHRRLRLTLARKAAEDRDLPYALIADRFGFAGGASFSHAYRRAFGKPPVRELTRRHSR